MKKFLSIALVAVMLLTSASLAVFAEAPKAADFTANNGFFIYDEAGNQTEVQDPADLSDDAKGLKVVHGGYYWSGDNCGGVVSNEKYDLNGFEATVYFETAPEVTPDTDCWVAMDFLAAPRAFFTGNFDVENGGNQGIMTLIRFSKPFAEIYDGVEGFSRVYESSAAAEVNQMFSITSGTTLTVKVTRNTVGDYNLTFAREGFEDFTLPYDIDMSDALPDGKAHFSVIASCKTAGEDAWTYYITDIKNGVAMTEEEIAAATAAKAEAEIVAKTQEATDETNRAKEKANEAKDRADATGDEAAIAKADEAVAAIEASYAAIEEQNWEEALIQSDLARDYAKEANDLSKEAEKAAEANGETNTDAPAVDEPTTTDAPAEGGVSPIVIVIIVVVVIAVIAVVVVATKKKK